MSFSNFDKASAKTNTITILGSFDHVNSNGEEITIYVGKDDNGEEFYYSENALRKQMQQPSVDYSTFKAGQKKAQTKKYFRNKFNGK